MPLPPICTQWKDSLREGLTHRLSKTEVGVVHPQVADLNNLDELSRISHPNDKGKMQHSEIQNFMDIQT
jgi:hypothetical protein